MDFLQLILAIVGGSILLLVLCFLAFALPSWEQYSLSRRIISKKTGKPLLNNNFKFPLGDLTSTLKDYIKGEAARLKYIPEGACGWWALNNYDVQVTNADWVRQLVHGPNYGLLYDRSFNSFTILNRLLGTSLLGCAGERWSRTLKVLHKAFSHDNLQAFVPVFVQATRRLADSLDSIAATRETHEMMLAFNNLTLDVIMDAGFGVDGITAEDKQTVLDAFRYVMLETQNPIHDIPILRSLPLPSNRRVNREFDRLFSTADKIMRARRAAYESNSTSDTHAGKYMIDLMISACDSNDKDVYLTDTELRDNTVMLMVAGSETTGTTLAWLLWHICKYPEVRKKVLAEIDSLPISWDHFDVHNFDSEMPYLTMVIKESLRMMPSISGIPERIFNQDSELGDLVLPKGSRVGAAQYVLHHNPENWVNPEEFIPERFTPENFAKLPKVCYLPFGEGVRTCLGKRFAMNEVRVVASLLLKYYDFKYDESNGPVEAQWRPPTIVPKNGLPMFVTHRTK